MNKELAIIKNNNEEATKEIRRLLNNNNLDVDLTKYNAEVNFNNEEILRTDKDRDGNITSSFRVYSMRVDSNTSDDIINNYADFLELSSIMMTSISCNDCDKMVLSVSDIYSAASCTGITTETSALEDLSDIWSPPEWHVTVILVNNILQKKFDGKETISGN